MAAGVATRLLLAAIVCGGVALSATTRARLAPSPARSSRAADTPVLDHLPGGGPDGGAVSSLAIAGAQSSLVFAAFYYGGVFTSSDRGVSWTPADRGLPATDACELVAVPRSSTVFAACGDGLFTTTNGGALWRQLDLDNAMPPLVAPSNPRVLYQPSFGAVVRSRDGGRRWETVASPHPTGCESDLAIDAVDPFVLFCGAGEWVRVSRDGGASWAPLGRKAVSAAAITAVAVDPLNPGIILAVDDDGRVFRASTLTAAWQQIGSAPEPEGLEALQFVGDAGVLFARQGSNVLRSLDGGGEWQIVFAGSPDVFPFGPSFAVDPSAPSTIFVGTGRGVMVTTDAGKRWAVRDRGVTRATASVALHDSPSPVLYASNGRELFASANDGETWSVVQPGAAADGVVASVASDGNGGVVARSATASYRVPRDQAAWIVLEPNDPVLGGGHGLGAGATLVKAGDAGFDYSLDGQAWQSARLPADKVPAAVAADAANPRLLYAATPGVLGGLLGGNGIWRSSDAGSTWTLVDEPGNGSIARCCRLVADPRASGTAYAIVTGVGIGGDGDLIRRTTDGGVTWTDLPLPGLAHSLTVVPTEPPTLLAEAFDGANGNVPALWASRDSGDSWHRAGAGLSARIANIAVDPRNPRRLFAATVGRGVYRSVDAGASWQATARVR